LAEGDRCFVVLLSSDRDFRVGRGAIAINNLLFSDRYCCESWFL